MWDASLNDLLQRFEVGELLTGGILVVDDERPNLTVLRSFLDGDYEVHEATSGHEALQIAESTPLDVIIADQRMPGMTGVEMLERLRTTRPDLASIVLTGYSDTPALISAINEARVFRYLKKPWQPDEVLGAVAQASHSVQQQRAIARLVDLLAARTDELSTALADLKSAQASMLHLERLATTGRLAAGITHDLRNAMTGLVFLDREAVDRGLEPEFVDCIKVGLAGVRNLLDSLETMNLFVRHRRLSMHMEYFDPAQVVKDAVTVMRLDLGFRARTVQIDAPEGLPLLLGDRHKLVQVLVNLMRNAIHATRDRQQVMLQVTSVTPSEVVYSVEDEGPGVPAEIRARLFDAFVSTKAEQGMGMGLYMSKLIVKNHSGRIDCLDRPGGGTRFEVGLPVPQFAPV